jgi:hypothetical protein
MIYMDRWGNKKNLRQKDSTGREYWISVDRPGDGWDDAYDKKINVYLVGQNFVTFSGYFKADEIDRNLVHSGHRAWSIAANGHASSVLMRRKHSNEVPKSKDAYRAIFVQDQINIFPQGLTVLEFELSYRQSKKLVEALTYGLV